ncbi:unnamed protein product [Rotaria socialis]|uniref:ABC transporter domain-containing protein n=1 Tax=Rotaria socialis TaxID=392032 RepID=A0A817V5E9_9BILA|nr:unnamed protein product [Rotaria socialis]
MLHSSNEHQLPSSTEGRKIATLPSRQQQVASSFNHDSKNTKMKSAIISSKRDDSVYDIDVNSYRYLSTTSHRKFVPLSINSSSKGEVSFYDIDYIVNGRKMKCKCPNICPSFLKEKPAKQILYGLSGNFKTGMHAIMGSTGCGKSSLLDILAHRKDRHGLSGQIFVDGSPAPSSFKYMVGYVVQDDIISETLTIRENLMFSANIRLPRDVSHVERVERVIKVISDLGLESCADTTVGTEFIRGVSGGERKRACIGMELILARKIFFLDEPTTGLDAATARKVMKCLSNLAKQGRTIIFSIHQPRYSIFKLFDTVTLLSEGEMLYHGQAKNLLNYFSQQGYSCEPHDNPADFVIDVLIDAQERPGALENLRLAYEKSSMHQHVMKLRKQQFIDVNLQIRTSRKSVKPTISLWNEFYYICLRTLKNTFRNPSLILSQIVVSIILGLLVGLVFFDLKKTTDPGVQNRLGVIFVIVVTQIFSTLTALEPLIKERALFIHENASGYYRTITFFCAKFLCDILLIRVIVSILFSLIIYFMTGFERDIGKFGVFLITIFMASLFGSSMCLLVAATVRLFSVAVIIVILNFLIVMLFSGYLIALKSIFSWLSWLQWVSAFRYATNMLTMSEFRNIDFCLVNSTNICPLPGSQVLHNVGLDYTTNWDLWKNFFGLSMMTVGLFLLAYIQLLRIKKTK